MTKEEVQPLGSKQSRWKRCWVDGRTRFVTRIEEAFTYSTFLDHSGGLLKVMNTQLVKIVHIMIMLNTVDQSQGSMGHQCGSLHQLMAPSASLTAMKLNHSQSRGTTEKSQDAHGTQAWGAYT